MYIMEAYYLSKLDIRNAMTNVYKGVHKIKQKEVVIKFGNDSLTNRLIQNEIHLYLYLKKCNFTYIPHIINTGVHNNNRYIITEYKNTTLNYITINIIDQLFTIIKSLHSFEIVHRDIKPENFLIDNDKVYIIDLGLSAFHSNRIIKSLVGNWKYCSPTCLQNEYVYEYKDDIIGLIYMILGIHNKGLPWTKHTYMHKKNMTFNYKADAINDDMLNRLFNLIL